MQLSYKGSQGVTSLRSFITKIAVQTVIRTVNIIQHIL